MDVFVSLPAQILALYEGGELLARYRISSAKNGVGEQQGSMRTPRGRHLIRAKIGAGQPKNTVFVARRPTGELWSPELALRFPERDWILTRILWLSGCEPGHNRLGCVDTMRRYVYIHGTPDDVKIGEPGSHGCLRMRNEEVIELFDWVAPYTGVNIGDFDIVANAQYLAFEAVDSHGEVIGECYADERGSIEKLLVTPAWRGKGVATQLLRALIERAAATELSALRVVWQGGFDAGWHRLGFVAASGSLRRALRADSAAV